MTEDSSRIIHRCMHAAHCSAIRDPGAWIACPRSVDPATPLDHSAMAELDAIVASAHIVLASTTVPEYMSNISQGASQHWWHKIMHIIFPGAAATNGTEH